MQSFPELPLRALADLGDAAPRTLVLTVNKRHARRLVADLANGSDMPVAQARAVRQIPRIVPLSAWLRAAADDLIWAKAETTSELACATHVLDAFAAQELWVRVIEEAEPQRPLLDARAAARLAQEANHLMVDWQLRLPDDATLLETARFAVWRQAYRAQLQALDAQDDACLLEAVLHAAERAALPHAFDTVVLAGFAELSPATRRLLAHLQDQGVQVVRLTMNQNARRAAAQAVQTQAPTHAEAWRAAAAWVAEQLRARPQGRFAIVAAQLEADMPFAHRVLREALGDAPYNMAVARPLNAWPLVRAALAWLRALTAYLQSPEQSAEPAHLGAALLAGACAGHAHAADHRAALDARWRHLGVLRVAHTTWVQQLTQAVPTLALAWQDAWFAARAQPRSATLDAWIAQFRAELRRLGFPGDATLDSAAHQTLQAFEQALDRAAALAFAFGSMRRGEAVGLLERMLVQTRFQPMRDAAARVDVLGLLEAEGGCWDAVWVLGLHDGVFPAAPRPNPLLPLTVLREAGTPRATVARELQWAQATLADLLCCAPQMVFSHAEREGEEPLRASPLLADLPVVNLDTVVCGDGEDALTPSPAEMLLPPCTLETLLDTRGPVLRAGGKPLRGGIGVIDTQARNPLWAFVKYRLGASLLPDYARPDDARARGNFLHYALELIWRLLPDQAALQLSWEQGRLTALIEQAIAQSADKHLQDLNPTLRRLEMARAQGIVHAWLALERARAPFRIEALEQTAHYQSGALELRVRLDRVDALADGSLLVIDYKTGAGTVAVRGDWMRARPVNVQLPFYATMLPHAPHPVTALVLVKLHARAIELRGLARDADVKGVDTPIQWPMFALMDWDAVMQHWRTAIQDVAQEVADGIAANIVLHPADVQYCDVLPFLRLNETVSPETP